MIVLNYGVQMAAKDKQFKTTVLGVSVDGFLEDAFNIASHQKDLRRVYSESALHAWFVRLLTALTPFEISSLSLCFGDRRCWIILSGLAIHEW